MFCCFTGLWLSVSENQGQNASLTEKFVLGGTLKKKKRRYRSWLQETLLTKIVSMIGLVQGIEGAKSAKPPRTIKSHDPAASKKEPRKTTLLMATSLKLRSSDRSLKMWQTPLSILLPSTTINTVDRHISMVRRTAIRTRYDVSFGHNCHGHQAIRGCNKMTAR